MRQALTRHPDSRCDAVAHIEADIARPRPGVLALSYVVCGRIERLKLPAVIAAARADELWRHTCLEAFFGSAPGATYYEFNFAPSTQWAAYAFTGYRAGMRVATEISAPQIKVQSSPERYALEATLDVTELSGLPRDAPWRMGLSAVIEETGGGVSYWALAHPAGKPDFHHFDCFAHELLCP
jgi:hypothetical protein